MKHVAITSLSVLALTLTACGQKAATTSATTDNTTVATTGDNIAVATPAVTGGQAFANTAAASDAFEIASSRLALTNATSASLKAFAQKMIDAHTDSTTKLKAAVAGVSPTIIPDPTLTAEQQAKLDAMKALTGKAFDQAYVAAQAEGHQKTLDALRAYSANGDVPELKTFATTLTPIVAAHLNMARSLKA